MNKEKELSGVLYGKRMKTNSSSDGNQVNFDIGSLTQMQDKKDNIQGKAHNNVVKLPDVQINAPVLKFPDIPIIVNPVINLNAMDLKQNQDGQLLVPEIKVELMININ